MTYSIKLTNGTTIVDIPDGVIDTATTSLNLVGRNVSGYGAPQNENFIGLLENFANTRSPESPLVGQLWFDATAKQIKIWSPTNVWKSLADLEVSSTKPLLINAIEGDLWYNSTAKQLNVFTGTDFDLIGTSIPGFGKSRLEGSVVLGTRLGGVSAVNNPILTLYVDDTAVAIISKYDFAPSVAIPGLHANSETPTRILPGINFIGDNEINGIADQSKRLVDPTDGPLGTDSFVRTDSSNTQTIQSSIWAKETVKIGTLNSDDTQHLLNISNYSGVNGSVTLDGQITYTGNKIVFTNHKPLGVKTDILMLDSSGATNVLSPVVDSVIVDLGTPTKPFSDIWADALHGSVIGDLTGNVAGNINGEVARLDLVKTRNGATTVIDLTKSTPEFYGKLIGTIEGSTVGTHTGASVGNLTGDVTGDVTGNVTGDVVGNVSGDVNGNVTGNIKGNLIASDNQIMINHTTRQIVGTLVGNASSASTLAVPRTINGVAFDGSQSINIVDPTRIAKTGDAMTGPLILPYVPTANNHAVNKAYVDQAIANKPLFFSIDTNGLSPTGSGANSVVSILNALAPPATIVPGTLCRVTSTIQSVTTTVELTYRSWISVHDMANGVKSVNSTVNNPFRNNNLVYQVNANSTSWEYVSG